MALFGNVCLEPFVENCNDNLIIIEAARTSVEITIECACLCQQSGQGHHYQVGNLN